MIDKNLAAYVKHLHENGYLLQNEVIAAQAIQYNWIVVTVDDAWDTTYVITPLGEIALGIQATEGDGDALENAILSVLKDSEPLTASEIRKELQQFAPDGKYLMSIVGNAIEDLNKAGKIVFRHDQYMNKLYFLPHPSTPAPDADTATGEYRAGKSLLGKDVYDVEYFDGKPRTVAYELEQTHARFIASILNTETRALRTQLASVQAENTRLQAAVEHSDNAANQMASRENGKNQRIAELERMGKFVYEKAIKAREALSDLEGVEVEAADDILHDIQGATHQYVNTGD